MNKQQILLLKQAKSYTMMAKILKDNGIDYRHYVIAARACISQFKAIESIEVTKTIRLRIVA